MVKCNSRVCEMFRFSLVGGTTFLVDCGLLYILAEWVKIYYLYAAAVSFTAAVALNYWLCVGFVFKNVTAQSWLKKALFIGSSVAGLGINQLCMWFMVEFMLLPYMLSKVFATVVVTVWNYVMKRRALVWKE